MLRRCAWWYSLRDAPGIVGDAESTSVYIPKSQVFSPAALTELMTRVSHEEVF